MLSVFTKDAETIAIGVIGFRVIGVSFLPMVTSLIFPVFFQAVGAGVKSSILTMDEPLWRNEALKSHLQLFRTPRTSIFKLFYSAIY